jgi:hypothetical protein
MRSTSRTSGLRQSCRALHGNVEGEDVVDVVESSFSSHRTSDGVPRSSLSVVVVVVAIDDARGSTTTTASSSSRLW